jgi:hypothetical protein
MIETPNSKLLNAIIVLSIVLIVVIVSSILSEKYEQYKKTNNKQNQNQTLEPFSNYQDVKTKTINWCKKMQDVGLLTPDQYDQCVATFKDVTKGVLPKEFKVPNTGLARNFSLYNTNPHDDSGQLSSSITGGNTNNTMIVTQTGLYMGCKPDNTIYFIKNINDPTINQQELYFTLVPQTSDIYAIMSPYKRYLISSVKPNNTNNSTSTTTNPATTNSSNTTSNTASNLSNTTITQPSNTEWTASFTGDNIGPMSTWTVSKVNNSVTFESIQYNGFFMSFNDSNNSLEIVYGSDDSTMWTMVPKEQTNVNNKYGVYTGVEFVVAGENILQKFKNIKVKIICLNAIKNALTNLQTVIRDNYTNITQYMQSKLSSNAATGLNENDINTVLNKITSMKDYYLQQIEPEKNKIDVILSTLNDDDVVIEYNKYLSDLYSELSSVKIRVVNNNKIIGRQQDSYESINTDYADIIQKQRKVKDADETSKLNIDLVNNYTAQTSYLLYIYPLLILILSIALLYLTYLTIMKFKANIYDKY